MKVILLALGVFCVGVFIGAAMLEVASVIREKLKKEDDHRH
tara:strand:- start:158 stop:280 length:123 start_codon:yes stop_codon:yes gene_type:complete